MTNTQLNLPNKIKGQATKAIDGSELRRIFIAEATAARKQFIKYGEGYEARDVHNYLRARITGKKTSSLKLKSW
jgi:hypothetical protein